MCVSACTQKTPNLRCCFLKRRLTNNPRSQRLAGDQFSLLLLTLASFQLVCATAVILRCTAPPACSRTLTAVHALPEYQFCRKYSMYIQTFCDYLNVHYIFDQSSAGRMSASSLVLLTSLPLTPRRHRQVDGQLSPLYPPRQVSARLAPLV